MILIFTYRIWLTTLANFLVVQTINIEPSDVIIVLTGDTERFKFGVSLYKQGYAPYIMQTIDKGASLRLAKVHLKWVDIIKEASQKEGIPTSALLLVEGITSTYDDARFTLDTMLAKNLKSAIVVSSPYHMRRVRMIFERIYKETGILLHYQPVKDSWFRIERWWSREDELIIVFNEYVKLFYYWFHY